MLKGYIAPLNKKEITIFEQKYHEASSNRVVESRFFGHGHTT